MATSTLQQMTEKQGIVLLDSLPPWADKDDFDEQVWAHYIDVARIVQGIDPDNVESILHTFIRQAIKEEFSGYESESKAFILMRVVFDIPEQAPVTERFSFKGWVNWPQPDANGQVNLAWPVSWDGGQPHLVASYAGSMGVPYAADKEYLFLRERFSYRQLT